MSIHFLEARTPSEYESNLERAKQKPGICTKCGTAESMWCHGSYLRVVIEASVKVELRIYRFKCKIRECAEVVTRLPSCLVPYRRYSAATIAAATESCICTDRTYLQQAEEVSGLDADKPRPSSSQIFRWLATIASRVESLLLSTQREIVMRDCTLTLSAVPISCPNSVAAKTQKKRKQLQQLAEFLDLAKSLVHDKEQRLSKIRAFFLTESESIREIFSGRRLRLPTPHNMQSLIF